MKTADPFDILTKTHEGINVADGWKSWKILEAMELYASEREAELKKEISKRDGIITEQARLVEVLSEDIQKLRKEIENHKQQWENLKNLLPKIESMESENARLREVVEKCKPYIVSCATEDRNAAKLSDTNLQSLYAEIESLNTKAE